MTMPMMGTTAAAMMSLEAVPVSELGMVATQWQLLLGRSKLCIDCMTQISTVELEAQAGICHIPPFPWGVLWIFYACR